MLRCTAGAGEFSGRDGRSGASATWTGRTIETGSARQAGSGAGRAGCSCTRTRRSSRSCARDSSGCAAGSRRPGSGPRSRRAGSARRCGWCVAHTEWRCRTRSQRRCRAFRQWRCRAGRSCCGCSAGGQGRGHCFGGTCDRARESAHCGTRGADGRRARHSRSGTFSAACSARSSRSSGGECRVCNSFPGIGTARAATRRRGEAAARSAPGGCLRRRVRQAHQGAPVAGSATGAGRGQ